MTFNFMKTVHMPVSSEEELPSGSGVFTDEELREANARHDRYYGWSPSCPNAYTNLDRFPETVIGDWYLTKEVD